MRARRLPQAANSRPMSSRERTTGSRGHLGHGDLEPDLALLQDLAKQEAAGAGRLVDGGIGQLRSLDRVQQVGLDLFAIEAVREQR